MGLLGSAIGGAVRGVLGGGGGAVGGGLKGVLNNIANKNPGKGLFGGKLKNLVSNATGGAKTVAPNNTETGDGSGGSGGGAPKSGESNFIKDNAVALGLGALGFIGTMVAVFAGKGDKKRKPYRR